MPTDISVIPESLESRGIDIGELKRFAEELLRLLKLEEAELSLVLTDDENIRNLNRDWRKKDRPTDVLSFPQDCSERSFPEPFDPNGVLEALRKELKSCKLLGDVVISVETARRQAEKFGRSLQDELKRLVLHGLVHLLGFDHERSPREEEKFRSFERFLWERTEKEPFPG